MISCQAQMTRHAAWRQNVDPPLPSPQEAHTALKTVASGEERLVGNDGEELGGEEKWRERNGDATLTHRPLLQDVSP